MTFRVLFLSQVKGSEVSTYDGTPVAYTVCPTETVRIFIIFTIRCLTYINYVSAHDNETLFDIVSLKTPMQISVEERCRINHLATSIIALSQVPSVFHMFINDIFLLKCSFCTITFISLNYMVVDVTGLAWEFPVQKLLEDMEVAPCLLDLVQG
ncbi:Pullulanase 1, chloroplastic [Vitis vinifera]|uniref:Pullulanase 1, chloroplastic n=1 Tax=Vitis vinifera TaxID=29760 RepID=A0A438DUK1_VITVI|nr:Pullulanase 1, chloroplastic [Vitis vinifera]